MLNLAGSLEQNGASRHTTLRLRLPNHLHAILVIKEELVRVQYIEPQRGRPRQRRNEYQHVIPGSVGSIIRSFKGAVTRICRQKGTKHFGWQRNYYEHVVRDEKDLARIRQYITDNPGNWTSDDNFPGNIHTDRIQQGMAD
jgi:putative transposase